MLSEIYHYTQSSAKLASSPGGGWRVAGEEVWKSSIYSCRCYYFLFGYYEHNRYVKIPLGIMRCTSLAEESVKNDEKQQQQEMIPF